MIEELNTLMAEHIYRYAVIESLCMASILIAMTIDLIFGIRKARINGEATTSRGLKKTCDKARKYFFSPLLCIVCIDLISCVVTSVPMFSMLWSVYCIFCEFMSVREKAWQKAEIRQQERTMRVLLDNKDDIAKALIEAMTALRKEDSNEDNR